MIKTNKRNEFSHNKENNGIPNPIDNKCMCCGKGFSQEHKDNYYIPIFKEEDRSNYVVLRTVKFKRLDIEVTRCAKCKKIQKRANFISFCFSFGIGLIIIALGLLLMKNSKTLGALLIVAGAITFIVLWLSKGEDLAAQYLEKKGVLSKEKAVQQYKEVAELLRNGWTLEDPTA